MSNNIKAIFNKLYVGNTEIDSTSNVNITGNVSTSGNLIVGIGSYVSFNGSNNSTLYGIKDDNGTLKYRNSTGDWKYFSTIINGYINFPDQTGNYPINDIIQQEAGFGLRDNNGVLEFKNRTGLLYTNWTPLGTGQGGSGSGSGNTAGQLFFNTDNSPMTLIGGKEYNINLTTPMQQNGKIQCSVWEFYPSSDGNIDTTWKIDKNDNNFVMYNFLETRIGTVTPSATFGNITLTASGFSWTVDDVGLEFYGYREITVNNVTTTVLIGQAVISSFITNSVVNANVRTNFTDTTAISILKLYLGLLDDDGSFKITSTNTFSGVYRIMPEGLVNLYGLNVNVYVSPDQLSYFTMEVPTNNDGTRWPDDSFGTFNTSCQVGHFSYMYNPIIAVNKNINLTAVFSSMMTYGRPLDGNTTKTKSTTSDDLNFSSYFGYYPYDLLFYIKDGKTVNKREKIFYNYNNSVNSGLGNYVANANYGNPEYLPLCNNGASIQQCYSHLYHGISDTKYAGHSNVGMFQYVPYNQSMIAVGNYFVICAQAIYRNYNANSLYMYHASRIIIVVYNSRGEFTNFFDLMPERVSTSVSNGHNSNNTNIPYFYPKLYNGNGNNFWVIVNTVSTNTSNTTEPMRCRYFNMTINISGAITNNNENFLYDNPTGGIGLRHNYISFMNSFISGLIMINRFNNNDQQIINNTSQSGYILFFIQNYSSSTNNMIPYLMFYSEFNEGASSNSGNSTSICYRRNYNFPFFNISRYMYPHLDVVSVNNDTYMIFSASTMTDINSYKLYYAYLPNNYVSTNFYTSTNNLLTEETKFLNNVQIIPKGIYDKNNNRILVVWNGKSTDDVSDSTLRGTYYLFINLSGNTYASKTTAVKLTQNVPAEGGYYNMVMKSNGNIHLLFNTGYNCVFEYVLTNGSNIFYPRLSPTRNVKHTMAYNKILNGVNYDGIQRYTYTGVLSVDIYNDKIMGVGQFINPEVCNYYYNDIISNGSYNSSSGFQYRNNSSQNPTEYYSIPTTSTFFSEVVTKYDWNIYQRITDSFVSSPLGDFTTSNIKQSIFKIYNNNYYVVFCCSTNIIANTKIFMTFSTNSGQSWSLPVRITTLDVAYIERNPDMIIDANGKMHIVFEARSANYLTSEQIYYVRCDVLISPITFTDIFASYSGSSISTGGISGIVGQPAYVQSSPKIVSCDTNYLFVCWYGYNASNSYTRIFTATHSNNGDINTRWIYNSGSPLSDGNWISYDQLYPDPSYNSTNKILVVGWLGKNSSNTVNNRIFYAASIDNGVTFTKNTTSHVLSSISLSVPILAFQLMIDNSSVIHVMFIISNVITNNVYSCHGARNSQLSLLIANSNNMTPQTDVFVTRSDSITSNLSNLTSTAWSSAYLLTNYRYSIDTYQGSGNAGYNGNCMQMILDNYGVIYYMYKMRIMSYTHELHGTVGETNLGTAEANKAYLAFCTYNGLIYSEIKSVLSENFHSVFNQGSINFKQTSTSGQITCYNYTDTVNKMNIEYSFTVDINKNTNNIFLVSNAFYKQFYGSATYPSSSIGQMYLYEYTQDNVFFGPLDYRPILTFDRNVPQDASKTSNTKMDLSPFSILLSNGKLFTVFTTANYSGTAFGINPNYGYICYGTYDPNNQSKFTLRQSNNLIRDTYASISTGIGSEIITERQAGNISTDTDYWSLTYTTSSNISKPVNTSMIVLGVCQDIINTSVIYILYRYQNTHIFQSNINFVSNNITGFENLQIIYSSDGGLTFNNAQVNVTLTTVQAGGDSNVCFNGSIFAYNNTVYVVYSNTTGKLFLSRLSFNNTNKNLTFVDTLYVPNTIVYTGTPVTTIHAGEGSSMGRHVLDYSFNSNNELLLHILYHGASSISSPNDQRLNKVYYYVRYNATIQNSLVLGSRTFDTTESVVPSYILSNTNANVYTVGYGDMVVDRTYNRIYIVYSTHTYQVSNTTYSNKEHDRYIVYTWKNMSDASTAWLSNTQIDICSGTGSGFSQAIYKNPNLTLADNFSSVDQYPKLYLKGNILHMVTLGTHYNSYYNFKPTTEVREYLQYNFYKYYKKDISTLTSRFINNNQPINKSQYFNIYNFSYSINRQFYLYNMYPSLLVDNNNTIHVLCNCQSNYTEYTTNKIRLLRNYHFLTMDDSNYKINKKATAITKSVSPLTIPNWTQIRDFILSDSSNSQTAFYVVCYQIGEYDRWNVFNGLLAPRLIMQYNRTTNEYLINTNIIYTSETLLQPTTTFYNNCPEDERTIKVLEEAMNYTQNQMSSQQLNIASNFGSLINPVVSGLRFAIILQTNDTTTTPQTSDLQINYSLGGYQLNVTNNYVIKIKSLSLVSFTPPNDNQTRQAFIYVTDGSSSGTTTVSTFNYTQIVQNINPITQVLSQSYAILSSNNGAYLTNEYTSNTLYYINTLNGGTIRINNSGSYKIDISFDYSVSDIVTTYFSIDGVNQEVIKSNNVSNVYDRVSTSTIVKSITTYNFSLYMKTDSNLTPNISIQNLKIYIQKIG